MATPCEALLAAVLAVINGPACAAFREERGLLGYVIVGSTALIGHEHAPGGDLDVVLVSNGPATHGADALAALAELHALLERAVALAECAIWTVSATVPLLKVQQSRCHASLDLLWMSGSSMVSRSNLLPTSCTTIAAHWDTSTAGAPPPGVLRHFAIDDPELDVPPHGGGGPAAECVRLVRLFTATLGRSRTFTANLIRRLRAWARARHVYGTRYGYPGGSAWTTMLWVFCTHLDRHGGAAHADVPSEDAVLLRFFTVVALWRYPLPWTLSNFDAILERAATAAVDTSSTNTIPPRPLDPTGLEASVGRHLITSFVVPMPYDTDNRSAMVWNMTQCVQAPNHRAILREAWAASAGLRAPVLDYRNEVRDLAFRRMTIDGAMRCRWPMYLSVALPAAAPPEWCGIVASRLMATLLPQLEMCGFVPRPLCVDRPAYLILLWPRDASTTTSLLLPLEDRILPCIYHMLESAYRVLYGAAATTERPRLERLIPTLDLQLSDL